MGNTRIYPNFSKRAVFILTFVLLLLAMQVLWSYGVEGRIYYCTDGGGMPDFLLPGNWVHGEVQEVELSGINLKASELDCIMIGWSVTKIWLLWAGMFMTALAISWALAKYATPQ